MTKLEFTRPIETLQPLLPDQIMTPEFKNRIDECREFVQYGCPQGPSIDLSKVIGQVINVEPGDVGRLKLNATLRLISGTQFSEAVWRMRDHLVLHPYGIGTLKKCVDPQNFEVEYSYADYRFIGLYLMTISDSQAMETNSIKGLP